MLETSTTRLFFHPLQNLEENRSLIHPTFLGCPFQAGNTLLRWLNHGFPQPCFHFESLFFKWRLKKIHQQNAFFPCFCDWRCWEQDESNKKHRNLGCSWNLSPNFREPLGIYFASTCMTSFIGWTTEKKNRIWRFRWDLEISWNKKPNWSNLNYTLED